MNAKKRREGAKKRKKRARTKQTILNTMLFINIYGENVE